MKTRFTALLALLAFFAMPAAHAEVLRGHATAAEPTYSEAQDKPFSLDLSGRVRVLSSSGTGASATQVQGTVAEDSPAANNPVQIGIEARTSQKTLVSSGDVVRPVGSVAGVQAFGTSATPADNASNVANQVIGQDGTGRPLLVIPMVYDGATQDIARGDSTGGAWVQGPAAQGATAAGNPVRDGCVYTNNANQPAVTTGQVVSIQCTPDGAVRTAPQRPTATDILVGYATVTATTASTTLITVSAGRTWVGTLCASVDGNKAAAATGNGLVNATFLTTGTNVVPAAGTYFGVSSSIGANAATGVTGTQGSNQGCTPFTTVAPAGNSTTINYATTCTNTTACAVHVSAIGVMQ